MTKALLNESIHLAIDAALLSDTPGSVVIPRGLLNGIDALATSIETEPLLAMLADVRTVVSAVASVGSNSRILLITDPAHAVALRSWPDRVGDEVMASSAIANALIAVASNCIASAANEMPRFQLRRRCISAPQRPGSRAQRLQTA